MTSAGIRIDGLNIAIQKVQGLGEIGEDVVFEVITDLVTDTHAFAVEGIQKGPATGRVYQRYNPRRTHRASAPGEYPMSDTGSFASSVNFLLPTPERLHGEVGTGDQRGPWLEFGTSKMAARPWLMPSFERARIGLEQHLAAKLESKI